MTVTNNSVQQINTALNNLRPTTSKSLEQSKLETLQEQILSEEEEILNPIETATYNFTNSYYSNTGSTDTGARVVTQNYFVFGEMLCIWGTFTDTNSGKEYRASNTSGWNNILRHNVNAIATERFSTVPVSILTPLGGPEDYYNMMQQLSVNYSNGVLSFPYLQYNNGIGLLRYSWCLIGKVNAD